MDIKSPQEENRMVQGKVPHHEFLCKLVHQKERGGIKPAPKQLTQLRRVSKKEINK